MRLSHRVILEDRAQPAQVALQVHRTAGEGLGNFAAAGTFALRENSDLLAQVLKETANHEEDRYAEEQIQSESGNDGGGQRHTFRMPAWRDPVNSPDYAGW